MEGFDPFTAVLLTVLLWVKLLILVCEAVFFGFCVDSTNGEYSPVMEMSSSITTTEETGVGGRNLGFFCPEMSLSLLHLRISSMRVHLGGSDLTVFPTKLGDGGRGFRLFWSVLFTALIILGLFQSLSRRVHLSI